MLGRALRVARSAAASDRQQQRATAVRLQIISRCRAKAATRSRSFPIEAEIDHGVPLFLNQLVDALRLGSRANPDIGRSAVHHGHDLLLQGFTVSQVVHDYGDVCQSITELAVEMNAPISVCREQPNRGVPSSTALTLRGIGSEAP